MLVCVCVCALIKHAFVKLSIARFSRRMPRKSALSQGQVRAKTANRKTVRAWHRSLESCTQSNRNLFPGSSLSRNQKQRLQLVPLVPYFYTLAAEGYFSL